MVPSTIIWHPAVKITFVFCKGNHKYSSSDCSVNREARDMDNQRAMGKISIEEGVPMLSETHRN